MGIRSVSGWMLALCVLTLCAGEVGAADGVRDQVQSTMLITGSIDIHGDGTVLAYALDREDELPPLVVNLARSSVPNWRFEPVEQLESGANAATAQMTLRILASPLDEDRYKLRISSAHFQLDDAPEFPVHPGHMPPPAYPVQAMRFGVSGIVYMVMRVRPDGTVHDVMVERVDLRAVDRADRMPRWRELFAQTSMDEARKWTFEVSPGADPAKPYYSIRVPIDYTLLSGRRRYGEWDAYVPGPYQRIPWITDEADGADALVAGGIYPVGHAGPRLLTPLGI